VATAPPVFAIDENEVHVWRARLDGAVAKAQHHEQTLDEDERKRADHFARAVDRQRFVVAHGILREIIGSYLRTEPQLLQFDRSCRICGGPHGKPVLRIPLANIRFNISHTAGLCVLAIAQGREVGIDVEEIREEVDIASIAKKFFTPQEHEALFRLPAGARRSAFFARWVRKEAYAKALGKGLTLPFDQFQISVEAGESWIEASGDAVKTPRWSLVEVFAGPGYAAALAIEGPPCKLRCGH